jgi:hypothetical protein
MRAARVNQGRITMKGVEPMSTVALLRRTDEKVVERKDRSWKFGIEDMQVHERAAWMSRSLLA